MSTKHERRSQALGGGWAAGPWAPAQVMKGSLSGSKPMAPLMADCNEKSLGSDKYIHN